MKWEDFENKIILQGTLKDVSFDDSSVRATLRIEREHESALDVECRAILRYLPDSSRNNLVPGRRVQIRGDIGSDAAGNLDVVMSTVAGISDSRDFSDVEVFGMLEKVIIPDNSFFSTGRLPEGSFFRIHVGPPVAKCGTVLCQIMGEFTPDFSRNDAIHARGHLSERLFMPGLPKLYIVPSYCLERDRMNIAAEKTSVAVGKDRDAWEY